MKQKQIKITFEYSNPNTRSIVSVSAAIFGVVFVIGLVVLCVLLT